MQNASTPLAPLFAQHTLWMQVTTAAAPAGVLPTSGQLLKCISAAYKHLLRSAMFHTQVDHHNAVSSHATPTDVLTQEEKHSVMRALPANTCCTCCYPAQQCIGHQLNARNQYQHVHITYTRLIGIAYVLHTYISSAICVHQRSTP